jgi:hypothetical protein
MLFSPRGETTDVGGAMVSELELSAVEWLRRLGQETGAFSVVDVAVKHRQQHEQPLERWTDPEIAKAVPDRYLKLAKQTIWWPNVEAGLLLADNTTKVQLHLAVRSRVTPAEAVALLERMEASGRTVAVLCSPSLSPRVQEMCRRKRVSYLDEAGNCRLAAPGLFIEIEGRAKTRSDTRATVDVFAPKSSRIARILLTDPKRGWQVQALAKEAQISLGLASKTKRALVEQAFAQERDGLLYAREPDGLLQLWSQRYQVTRLQRTGVYTLDKLSAVEQRANQWSKNQGVRCALTDFAGAWRLAPMVRYNRASIYVESQAGQRELIADLGLKPVATGANLFLCTPYDPSVFYDQRDIDGLSVVSPIQLYLDLIRERGRGQEAAQEIFAKHIKPTW